MPLRALAENAGYRGDVAVEKVKELPLGQGLDCMTGEYGDMIGRGIADPAKVTVTALQAAASVAPLSSDMECARFRLTGMPRRL